MLEITNTVDKKKMKAQILDGMDIERERGITPLNFNRPAWNLWALI